MDEFPVTPELYQLLVDSVSDYAIFLLDPKGFVRSWNDGARRLKGYEAGEIIGKHFSVFYPVQELRRRKPEYELAAAAAEGRFEDEGWRVRKDGSRFWANVVITALRRDDLLVGYAKVTRDLTARKEAEDERRQLLQIERAARARAERSLDQLRAVESLTEATLSFQSLDQLLQELLDRIGRLLEADTTTILLLEENQLAVAVARGIPEGALRDVHMPLGQGFAGRIAAERRGMMVSAEDPAFPAVFADEGVRSLAGVPLIVDGRVTGVLHVGSTSGRRFNEEDLRLLQIVGDRCALGIEHARLYEAERAAQLRSLTAEAQIEERDMFLSVAAHELKTPITALYGMIQLLERRAARGSLDQEELRDIVARLRQQGTRLVDLVGRLFEVGQFDLSQVTVAAAPLEVASLVEETVDAVKELHRDRAFHLSLQPGVLARLDAMRLGQLLTNLIENAVKFSPPTASVDLSAGLKATGELEIAVRDHGVGVQPEHRPHIFERFYQAHGRSHRSGLGLGLFLAREIARAHGGDLRAEFPESGGSRFVASFPADRVLQPTRTAEQPRRGLVLVVDDDETIRSLVAAALADEGFQVRAAANGADALDAARDERPDLVLLDMRMPVMDGWEFARLYRDMVGGGAPILVMTAAADARQRAQDIGAQGHISKPFDLVDLVETVGFHIGQETRASGERQPGSQRE